MNAKEFLHEVLTSEQCPDNFEKIYEEFQTYQSDALRTLIELHRVCEKHRINYQLTYGSLLGVIRDGGQIPWDYDIDVILPIEDKETLIAALEKDLDPAYYYYCPENNKKCRHMIMRIAPKEYRTEALHVDVFFLTGSPEDKEERVKYKKEVHDISELRYAKLVNAKEASNGDYRRYFSFLIKRNLPTFFIPLKRIERRYEKVTSKYSSKKSTICISADSYADWCEYPTAILWETKLIDTNFGEIRIPVHYDELLTLMYGDYSAWPSLQDRIGEVMKNYERIRYYQNL